MKVLLTGATGFIGRALVDCLLNDGVSVQALVRSYTTKLPAEVVQYECGDFSNLEKGADSECKTILDEALVDVDVVVHLAARVHVMNDRAEDPLSLFRQLNRDATLGLAKRSAEKGVERFVYLSSIKVNGELSPVGKPFRGDDTTGPTDPYGLSKYEAENALLELAGVTKMGVVIIRPPLVYGPGVKANFASIVKIVKKGFPIPLALIRNKRSLVALENLVDFIALCADLDKSPKAANQIFLISDDEDVSTPELIRKIAYAYGLTPRLFPFPVSWMRFIARLLGKEDVAARLFGSLQVDISKAKSLLGWKPVVSMDEQLKKMGEVG